MRILLIEDNEDDAVLLEEILAGQDELPVEVVQADCLSAAAARLEQGDFDIILLDLSLPDGQGLATLKTMQGHAPWLPIIVMTGLDDNRLAQSAVHEGAQDYLVKGQYDHNILVRAIRYAIERQLLSTNLRYQTRELRASEGRFRRVIERSTDAILIVSNEGMVRYLNPAATELFKHRGDDILLQPFGFPIQEVGFVEITIPVSDDKRVTAELHAVEIDWEGEKAHLTTLHDITRRKELDIEIERARHQQLEMKDQFIAHISHELRSPITAAYQFTTILLDGLAGEISAKQREYLEIALRNIGQFRAMIEDLLEVTRAETGKLAVEAGSISLNQVIGDCVESMRPAANAKSIVVTDDTKSELPSVFADYKRVRQILVNLINNSIKFTPKEGRVSVSADIWNKDANFVCVAVTDTGCGISPDGVEKIFERLYQESSGDESRKGLGLGLHICKQLVTRQGGKIWVESGVGKGSTFYFTLPIYSLEQLLPTIVTGSESVKSGVGLVAIAFSKPRGAALGEGFESLLESLRDLLAITIRDKQDLMLPGSFSSAGTTYLFIVTATDHQGIEMMAQRLSVQLKKMRGLTEAGVLTEVTHHAITVPPMSGDPLPEQFMSQLTEQILTVIEATTKISPRDLFPTAQPRAGLPAPTRSPQDPPDLTVK